MADWINFQKNLEGITNAIAERKAKEQQMQKELQMMFYKAQMENQIKNQMQQQNPMYQMNQLKLAQALQDMQKQQQFNRQADIGFGGQNPNAQEVLPMVPQDLQQKFMQNRVSPPSLVESLRQKIRQPYEQAGQAVLQTPKGWEVKTKPRLNAEINRTSAIREDQFRVKRVQQMGDDLDWNKNVRSAYGVTAQGLHRAERLDALVSRYPDFNLDRRETEELAIGLNAILAGSNQSAQEQVSQLVPRSITGNTQKLTEWLFNTPQGLSQQKFVQRMYNDVTREKDTMYNQLIRDAHQKLSKYSDIEKKYPEDWNNTLLSWGINPGDYRNWRTGGFRKMNVVPNNNQSQGNQYMQNIGGNYQQNKQRKTSSGMGFTIE